MSEADKERKELSQRVKKLRKETGLNQTDFAALVEVKQSVVSTWEQGAAFPSGQNYARLGNAARDYLDRKWFWEKAGIDMGALDVFCDMRAKEKTSSAEFIEISCIDSSIKETIPFASQSLPNPASTRFIRLANSEPPFGRGDIILVDTRFTNLLEFRDGDLIAVGDGIDFFALSIGTLARKNITPSLTHFILDQPHGGGRFIASAKGKAVPKGFSPVMGKVVAWIHGTGEHGKYRHFDREGILATHKAIQGYGKQKK